MGTNSSIVYSWLTIRYFHDVVYYFTVIVCKTFPLLFIFSDPSETAVIKEIYDSENAHEAFVDELERALESGCKFIIIEPPRLGDETARWIAVGNCLHKTAVISGVSAIICGMFSWLVFK